MLDFTKILADGYGRVLISCAPKRALGCIDLAAVTNVLVGDAPKPTFTLRH